MAQSQTITIPCSGINENDFHLKTTTLSSNFTSSYYPYENMCDLSSSSNYGRITLDNSASAKNYFYLTFDFSSIPKDAIITQVDGKVRLYSSGTTTYCKSRQIRWCLGNGET